MISGIVLAAGASSRMGRPKAALPIGDAGDTVLSRVVRTLLEGGVPRVVVVAGAHVDAVRGALVPFADATGANLPFASVRMIEHPGWEQGQLSSLLAGLDAVDADDLDAVMVTPVDVPLVSAATVAAVIDAWRATRAPIVRPARGARHGHPVIFDRAIFEDLRAADLAVGAKAVFKACAERVLNVEVQDAGAFEDIDTPEDYEKIRDLGIS